MMGLNDGDCASNAISLLSKRLEFYSLIKYCIEFIIVLSELWYLICVHQLELVLYAVILYTIWFFDLFYVYFQSILSSIIELFIQLFHIFINCIVIGFNHGECALYDKLIWCNNLSFFDSLMIYSPNTMS